MTEETTASAWDFDSAINLLTRLQLPRLQLSDQPPSHGASPSQENDDADTGLGNFSSLWDYLGEPRVAAPPAVEIKQDSEEDFNQVNRNIRWRDEIDGADLEDNIEPVSRSAANARTINRAARRARARERARKAAAEQPERDTTSEPESGEELEALRRSPDRRAVIDNILGRKRPGYNDSNSPPTSPSPPKAEPAKRDWPVSNPFLWTAPGIPSLSRGIVIQSHLSAHERKHNLITTLRGNFPEEATFLRNNGLYSPEFSALNVSSIGVHVFIDISNISIGFHDCLKVARGMPRDTRVRRIPLDFHNFSLVLERGRPAAKRVLVGSDKVPAIETARSLGYEANILERVHKAKDLTARQIKYLSRSGGETSGSETNTGLTPRRAEKWVEQAVDEILHLKILESLIDTNKPSTIVLATGDAAEAEYSGGFLRMVERALEKGWIVELVSFKANTSSLYKRRDFRSRWGQMFKWVPLDEYAELLIDGHT